MSHNILEKTKPLASYKSNYHLPEGSPLSGLVGDFLDHLLVERNVSPLTIRNYRLYLVKFISWLFEYNPQITIQDVDLEIIKAYRLFLNQQTDQKGELIKLSTQAYYIIALRSFLKWLAKNDYKVLNYGKIDVPKHDALSLKFLSAEQVEFLLAQPYISTEIGARDKAILEVLFSTGLRVSELVSLNRDQVNLKTREFGIIGKGRRHRVVFLSPRAVHWLAYYFDKRLDDWQPVFIRYAKGEDNAHEGEKMRLTPRSVQRIIKKYVRRAKLPVDATTHTLRHSFATDLLMQGADIRSVQEFLGHKNIATTQIYTHVTNAKLKELHDKYHGKDMEE